MGLRVWALIESLLTLISTLCLVSVSPTSLVRQLAPPRLLLTPHGHCQGETFCRGAPKPLQVRRRRHVRAGVALLHMHAPVTD
ncbi:hypothetical protein B0H10DRAFT_2080367 [Mycena sp. CBHHK59/15]|nr:hypothetical protein B0H10DRAFT_2080367 [Mycena sp. CBHHK59/15]